MPTVPHEHLLKLLTSAEVAELLQVKSATLSDWRNQRVGPDFIRAGANKKQIRYTFADIQAWIEQQRVSCSSSNGEE